MLQVWVYKASWLACNMSVELTMVWIAGEWRLDESKMFGIELTYDIRVMMWTI
jgi:hypothetical protein